MIHREKMQNIRKMVSDANQEEKKNKYFLKGNRDTGLASEKNCKSTMKEPRILRKQIDRVKCLKEKEKGSGKGQLK